MYGFQPRRYPASQAEVRFVSTNITMKRLCSSERFAPDRKLLGSRDEKRTRTPKASNATEQERCSSFDEDALYPAIMSLVDDEPFATGAKVLNQQPRSLGGARCIVDETERLVEMPDGRKHDIDRNMQSTDTLPSKRAQTL